MQTLRVISEGAAILSLDTTKAFDRVDWHYLWHVIHRLGFGPNCLGWVRFLYVDPTARVNVNNALSKPLQLKRGTRQDCPLSPLSFAIAMEPLAEAIWRDGNIKGFYREGREEKIALYADDVLFS